MIYRYASTLGPRFSMPLYFPSLEEARRHHDKCQKVLGDLPYMDTMRVEYLDDHGEWKHLNSDDSEDQTDE